MLQVSAGRIIGEDETGRRFFNTDDGLFHPVDVVSNTIAIAQYVHPDGTNLNSVTQYLVGTCRPECTDVIGSVKPILNNNAAGMAYDRWHTIMGGSIMWLLDGHGLTGSSPDPNGGLNQMIYYWFSVESGNVYLNRQRLFSKTGQGIYTVLSHSFVCKLKAGYFT